MGDDRANAGVVSTANSTSARFIAVASSARPIRHQSKPNRRNFMYSDTMPVKAAGADRSCLNDDQVAAVAESRSRSGSNNEMARSAARSVPTHGARPHIPAETPWRIDHATTPSNQSRRHYRILSTDFIIRRESATAGQQKTTNFSIDVGRIRRMPVSYFSSAAAPSSPTMAEVKVGVTQE